MRFCQVQFLDYQISMSLIGFDFPSCRRAAKDSVEEPALRSFLNGFALGGRRGRSGSGTSHLLPPTVDGPGTHALGLDLESVLKSLLEPLDSVSGSNGGEIIPVKECSEVSLAVVIQSGVALTTLEPQLAHLLSDLLLPVHGGISCAV